MADDPTPDPTPDPAPDPTPDPQPAPDPKPDPDATVTMTKVEADALRREVAEQRKAAKKASDDAKRAEDARKAEQGQWKELAEEREREAEALKAEIAQRDVAEQNRQRRERVTTVAGRLNFRDPSDAYALLAAEDKADSLIDDQIVEMELKSIVKRKPYLVDQSRRTGAPMSGGGNGAKPDPAQEHSNFIADLLSGAPPRT